MKKYTKVNVPELLLEHLVRQQTGTIEEGLVYVDHQKPAAGGRLDVLLVDSGKAFVVAELKVVQDDAMLMQGVDYYDYVSKNIEAFARLYKSHAIDPTQPVRLLLVAPSFSQTLVNRCTWIDIPISLFTFHCLKFENDEDLVPIFAEHPITTPPEVVEVTPLADHLGYITDLQVRNKALALMDEIKNWKIGNIAVDSVKSGISLKVNNHVFGYFYPRRQYYMLCTYDAEEVWTAYSIKLDEDLVNVKPIMMASMERKAK